MTWTLVNLIVSSLGLIAGWALIVRPARRAQKIALDCASVALASRDDASAQRDGALLARQGADVSAGDAKERAGRAEKAMGIADSWAKKAAESAGLAEGSATRAFTAETECRSLRNRRALAARPLKRKRDRSAK